MVKRRDYAPLGRGHPHAHPTWSPVSCMTGFLWIIAAVAVLSVFSIVTFSMLPNPETNPDGTRPSPRIRSNEEQHEHIAFERQHLHTEKPVPISYGGGEEVVKELNESNATQIHAPGQTLQRNNAFKYRPDEVVSELAHQNLEVKSPGEGSKEQSGVEENPNEVPAVVKAPDVITAPKVMIQNTSLDLSQEGTRDVSISEQKGAWRLTQEIVDWAKKNPKAEVASEVSPLAILFREFLSSEEIEHMVEIAKTNLARSRVVSSKNESMSDSRTSYGAWLSGNLRDPKVIEIEQRIHNTVGIPHCFGEGIYVLRYELKQKYDPHNDNCGHVGAPVKESCVKFLKRAGGPKCGEEAGGATCGDRLATFIMYLRSPMKGGETVFPHARLSEGAGVKDRKIYVGTKDWWCGNDRVFSLSPNPGDGVLFWDYMPKPGVDPRTYKRNGTQFDGTMDTEVVNDPTALHGGCPVLEGEKWIATRWIRSSLFK